MSYFEGSKIQVDTTDSTTRMGERYVINLRIAGEYGFVNEAKVIMNQQKGTNEREIEMDYISTDKNDMNLFSCEVYFGNTGLYYFCFKLIINGSTKWIKYNKKRNCACMTENNMPYWTITVYEKDYHVPEWAKGKIMYQIFPDRFFRSKEYMPENIEGRVTKKWGEVPNWKPDEIDGKIHNNDFFMGNLKGITNKLDYLKELGVEIIYLNPIFMSQSNHRYDTADYEIIDPYLGNNDDMIELCDEAHKRKMFIIIDAVFNHTGNDSKYFNEFGTYDSIGAYQSTQSPYYNWYKKDSKSNFKYWWGFKNLPVCDGSNTDWQNFIYGKGGVIDKWFSFGIDGIRLDVADELTDEFIENVRIAVKRNKEDGFIIGEVWDNAITKEGYGKQRTYLLGKGLDSVMNYPFTNAILKYVRFGKYEYFVETLNEILSEYPKEVIFSLMNSLSTHDITRAMTTLVGDGIQKNEFNWVWDVPYSRNLQFAHNKLDTQKYEKSKKLMKIATTIQYFLPGNPCIYYGDEVGMYGYRDPFNRMCFPWENIDEEMHTFYTELGKVRNKLTFLAKADIKIVEATKDMLAFERYNENEKVLIVVNRSENEIKANIPKFYEKGKTIFEINSNKDVLSNYGILIKTSKL